ncbi:MAG: hypothetical protein Q8Q96_01650 [bacterium]|nr:hypothetical protein [bacterium]
MTERRSAGQGGLAVRRGQKREDLDSSLYFVDPEGRVYRREDADAFVRRIGSRDNGYYGDSSLADLGADRPGRVRRTKRFDSEE